MSEVDQGFGKGIDAPVQPAELTLQVGGQLFFYSLDQRSQQHARGPVLFPRPQEDQFFDQRFEISTGRMDDGAAAFTGMAVEDGSLNGGKGPVNSRQLHPAAAINPNPPDGGIVFLKEINGVPMFAGTIKAGGLFRYGHGIFVQEGAQMGKDLFTRSASFVPGLFGHFRQPFHRGEETIP